MYKETTEMAVYVWFKARVDEYEDTRGCDEVWQQLEMMLADYAAKHEDDIWM